MSLDVYFWNLSWCSTAESLLMRLLSSLYDRQHFGPQRCVSAWVDQSCDVHPSMECQAGCQRPCLRIMEWFFQTDRIYFWLRIWDLVSFLHEPSSLLHTCPLLRSKIWHSCPSLGTELPLENFYHRKFRIQTVCVSACLLVLLSFLFYVCFFQ